MKKSALRKKSPAFRQGYHTGGDETLRAKVHTIKTGDDPENWQAYVDKMKGQATEEYLAGDIEGYRRGWGDGKIAAAEERAARMLAAGVAIGVVMSAVLFWLL